MTPRHPRYISAGRSTGRAIAVLALFVSLMLVFPLVSCVRETAPSVTSIPTSGSGTTAPTAPTATTAEPSPTPTTIPPTPTLPPRPEKTVSDGARTFYEIFVRSYYDSDGNGLGDLAGVTAKLDYVAETLGADGIWLMPICPSPTYHKYDVTDYLAIDPEYGTLDDFDRLIEQAHRRDIRVIVDLVLNHTSNLHPWFDQAVQALWSGQDSPYIDYYHFTTENKGQGYNKITDKYYYECRFVSGMPDLNLDSPAVRSEIEQITRFWLDRGVDGFRLDAVTSFHTGMKEKNIAFLSWLNETVQSQAPDAYLIGEVWSDRLTIADYYAGGIDSFFNFPFSQIDGRLVSSLNDRRGRTFARDLADWNTLIRQTNATARDALFLSNHDQGRSAGFLMRNLTKQKMAAALYLLAPGNPFIYYGEEIGMTGSGVDPNKRLPMIWSETDRTGMTYPPPGSSQTITDVAGVDAQIHDPDSLLRFYRQVLDIKVRHPEIARGDMVFVDTGHEGVAAWTVTWQEKTVAVVHQLADETVRLDLGQIGLAGFELAEQLKAGDSADSPALDGSILILPPMTTVILD